MGKKKSSKKKGVRGFGNGGGSNNRQVSQSYGGGISLSGKAPTVEECLNEETISDNIGRMFCQHNRDFCQICCVDYRMGNRVMEEAAGLRKKETEVEEAARMYATTLRALRGMERMVPRPSEQVFQQNRDWRDEYKAKLDQFALQGEDVESAIRKAIDVERSSELENEAIMQAMARKNPGQTQFELGGEESQKLYDEFVRAPDSKANRADYYTCAYCGKTGTKKLLQCSRCKKVSYCGKECQLAAWPTHKKNECVKIKNSETELKKQSLTWEQVEAHQGQPAKGKLQVRAIKDESMMRQVFQCRDRVGMCRRIAAYTDSRRIPGLKVGATLTWKNPRFHYFMDGSSGARIEEEDLSNVTVA
jgi:hypothetical protein